MLSCGKTSDILICPNCKHYTDGMPSGYLRPWQKPCPTCGHRGLEEAVVKDLLDRTAG